jgi:hypothetical protein
MTIIITNSKCWCNNSSNSSRQLLKALQVSKSPSFSSKVCTPLIFFDKPLFLKMETKLLSLNSKLLLPLSSWCNSSSSNSSSNSSYSKTNSSSLRLPNQMGFSGGTHRIQITNKKLSLTLHKSNRCSKLTITSSNSMHNPQLATLSRLSLTTRAMPRHSRLETPLRCRPGISRTCSKWGYVMRDKLKHIYIYIACRREHKE